MATNDNPYLDPVTGVLDTQAPPTTTDPTVLPEPVGEPRPPLDPEGALYDVPATQLEILEAARPPGSTTGQYVTPESTVAGQMTSLLEEDNPYMKSLDARGTALAQKYGLASSSMALGAMEAERIKGVLPIAQQDAQLYGTSALKEQEFANTTALTAQKASESSALQRQGHTENLAALDAQADHQLRLEAFSQESATQRSQMEMEFKASIANAELDSNQRTQYLASASDMGNQYNADVGSILRSKDFASEADRTEALYQLDQVYRNNMDFLAGAAGMSLDWQNPGGSPATAPPAVPATIDNGDGTATTTQPDGSTTTVDTATGGVIDTTPPTIVTDPTDPPPIDPAAVNPDWTGLTRDTVDPIIASKVVGTPYEGISTLSYANYNAFVTDFATDAVYATDEYWGFQGGVSSIVLSSTQTLIGSHEENLNPQTGLGGQEEVLVTVPDYRTDNVYMTPEATEVMYNKIMFASLNPDNPQAQSEALAVITKSSPNLYGKPPTLSSYLTTIEEGSIPPSEYAALPLWQLWVNENAPTIGA